MKTWKIATKKGEEIVEHLEAKLTEIAKANHWFYRAENQSWGGEVFFADKSENSKFIYAAKGKNGDEVGIAMRIPFVGGIVPNAVKERKYKQTLTDTYVSVNSIDEIDQLVPYIEKAWKNAVE